MSQSFQSDSYYCSVKVIPYVMINLASSLPLTSRSFQCDSRDVHLTKFAVWNFNRGAFRIMCSVLVFCRRSHIAIVMFCVMMYISKSACEVCGALTTTTPDDCDEISQK